MPMQLPSIQSTRLHPRKDLLRLIASEDSGFNGGAEDGLPDVAGADDAEFLTAVQELSGSVDGGFEDADDGFSGYFVELWD